MYKYFVSAGLALLTMTACTAEMIDETAGAGKSVVTVSIDGTRTHLGDKVDGAYKVYWSDGDRININGYDSAPLSGIGDESSSAVFTFDGLLSEPYDVVYPAEAYAYGKVKLPVVQNYVPASFSEGAAVLLARGGSEGVSLRNACGFVKINILGNPEYDGNIRYVKFYGNAGEQLSGEFDVDFENASLVLPDAGTDYEDYAAVTVNAPDGGIELFDTEPVPVIIALPAQTFSRGFTVEIVDADNNMMKMSSDKEQTVEAGQILSMSTIEYVPSGTVDEIVITTADEMYDLAQTVADGDLCAGKTYVLGCDIDFAGKEDWPGIGTADLTGSFAGTFDGRGYTIKNLRAVNPVFNYTAQGAIIKNVVVDSSCSFQTDGQLYMAALVRMNRAEVTNCVNRADVSCTADGLAVCAAGVVARAYRQGVISKCENYGTITVDVTSTVAKQQVVSGGVVATFERNGDGDLAQVRECTNYGTVVNKSDVPRLCTGGVVGRSTNASCQVESCANFGDVKADYPVATISDGTVINQLNYVGGVIGQSTGSVKGCVNHGSVVSDVMAVESRVGGVAGTLFAGDVTVSGCSNAAEGSVSSYGARGVSDVNVVNNHYLGGVVGQSEASVVDCANSGTVNGYTDAGYLHVGGVVGMGKNTATYTGNRNEKDALLNISSIAGEIFGGGVYGRFLAAQTISDAGTYNRGNIILPKVDGGKAVYAYCGGIVARTVKNSVISNMINEGTLDVYVYPEARFVATGGIMAVADCSVESSSNLGKISVHSDMNSTNSKSQIMTGGIIGWSATEQPVRKCSNDAEINVTGTDDCLVLRAHTGGIVGYANTEINIDDCHNYKEIHRLTVLEKANGVHSATGGIIGTIASKKASISNCTNAGAVIHEQSNNSYDAAAPLGATQAGGIVGLALGIDNGNLVSITNCSNSGEVANKRCHAGGIAGYAMYALIDGCRFTGIVKGTGPSHSGGIAGVLSSATVNDCVVKSECIYGHTGTVYNGNPCRLGGGVAAYAKDAAISDCKVFATISRNQDYPDETGTASVVSVSDVSESGEVSVTRCGVGGSHYLGLGDGSFQTLLVTLDPENYESYISSDNNAVVTDCYYWDGQE